MLRGYYLAANAMLNKQRTIDTISNNVANTMTAGYKVDTAVQNTFEKELILMYKGKTSKGGTIEYQFTEETSTALTQGSFEFTERPLDLAIQGNVYFNLQTASGDTVLSRNGQFSIDDEGYLYLPGGGRLLGKSGPIKVDKSDFAVTNNGDVYIDEKLTDSLALTYIADGNDIQKYGDSTFVLVDQNGEIGGLGEQIPADVEYAIIQGAFETSNVDMAVEMTKVMAAQRSFEALAQAIKMLDVINQKAASEIGKL